MTMKKCTGPCKLTKSTSEFYKRTLSKDGLQPYCKLCECEKAKKKYKKTGYRLGRPCKGEIRPETPLGKQNAIWRKNNPERSLEISRAASEKFRRENPEKVKSHGKSYRLRTKGWAGTTLSVVENTVVVTRKNQKQVIHVQVDG